MPALQVMANATFPGGAFRRGARAQEEGFCRRFNLWIRLRMAYDSQYYPLTCGKALVTPGVCRGGPETNYAPLPDSPSVRVTAISAAAMSFRSEDQSLAWTEYLQ